MTAVETLPTEKASVSPALLVLITVSAIVLPCLGTFVYNSVKGDAESGAGASVACKDYVRDRLNHPASANFSGLQMSGAGARWTLTGSVSADKSLGASGRMSFSCTVNGSAGSWSLIELTGLKG
jgi:hypothetical protein